MKSKLFNLFCIFIFIFSFSFSSFANPLSIASSSDVVSDEEDVVDEDFKIHDLNYLLSHAVRDGVYSYKRGRAVRSFDGYEPCSPFPLLHMFVKYNDYEDYGDFIAYYPTIEDYTNSKLFVFYKVINDEKLHFKVFLSDKFGHFHIGNSMETHWYNSSSSIDYITEMHFEFPTTCFPKGKYELMFQSDFLKVINSYLFFDNTSFLYLQRYKNHVSPLLNKYDSRYLIKGKMVNPHSTDFVDIKDGNRYFFDCGNLEDDFSRLFLRTIVDTSGADFFRIAIPFVHPSSSYPKHVLRFGVNDIKIDLRFSDTDLAPSFVLPNYNASNDSADTMSNINNSLDSLASGQNLVLGKLQEIIQHISDQLFAFWNQLAHEFTNLYAKLDAKSSRDTRNITSSIIQSNQNLIDNEKQLNDKTLNGYDNSTITGDNQKLNNSIDSLNKSEDKFLTDVNKSLNDFKFDVSFINVFSDCIKFILFLIGEFYKICGISPYITFSIFILIASMFIGLYRFRS